MGIKTIAGDVTQTMRCREPGRGWAGRGVVLLTPLSGQADETADK